MILIDGDRDQDLRELLEANDDDPWVRVSTVAEYVFCPRAGLITHESEIEDRGEEERTYDILPRYEKEAIDEERRTRLFRLLYLFALFFTIVFVDLFFIPDRWRRASDLIAMVALAVTTVYCIRLTWDLLVLLWRYDQACRGVAREPDPDLDEIQPVAWWDLLECKFDSTKPKELQAEEMRLRGRPLRVLTRGDVAIPVFRTKSDQTEPKPQQITRIMAYCVLVGFKYGHVPYGVILFGKSYKGVAVPNEKRFRKQFVEALVAVRKMIKDSRELNSEPGIPENRDKCLGCPLGRPRKLLKMKKTYKYGTALDPFVVKDKRNRPFHSDCGDRFEWIPPHRDKEKLGLRSS